MPKKTSKTQKNVYIDSDVIVAAEIDNEINHSHSQDFMKYITGKKNPDFDFFTSVFTSLELASAMIRRTKNKDKAYSLLYRITKTWKRSINPLPPMPTKEMTSFTRLVDSLIETSISFNTPSGDTIHAQTAALWEMHYFVTWNKKHFMNLKRQLGDIKVLDPCEMLTEIKTNYQSNKSIIMSTSTLISPKDLKPSLAASSVDVNSGFSWPVMEGAIRYEFELSKETGQTDKFSKKSEVGISTNNTFILTHELNYNSQYWWRVRAVNNSGIKSSWTTSFFTTHTKPNFRN